MLRSSTSSEASTDGWRDLLIGISLVACGPRFEKARALVLDARCKESTSFQSSAAVLLLLEADRDSL